MESESEETPLDFPNASSQHKIIPALNGHSTTLKSSYPTGSCFTGHHSVPYYAPFFFASQKVSTNTIHEDYFEKDGIIKRHDKNHRTEGGDGGGETKYFEPPARGPMRQST